MIRTRLVTAMVLSMIAGIAAAQSSTTSTTSTQSTAPAPAQGSASSRETTNGKGRRDRPDADLHEWHCRWSGQ